MFLFLFYFAWLKSLKNIKCKHLSIFKKETGIHFILISFLVHVFVSSLDCYHFRFVLLLCAIKLIYLVKNDSLLHKIYNLLHMHTFKFCIYIFKCPFSVPFVRIAFIIYQILMKSSVHLHSDEINFVLKKAMKKKSFQFIICQIHAHGNHGYSKSMDDDHMW